MTHTSASSVRHLLAGAMTLTCACLVPSLLLADEPGPPQGAIRSALVQTGKPALVSRSTWQPTVQIGPAMRQGQAPAALSIAPLQALLQRGDRILSPGFVDQGYVSGRWQADTLIGQGERVLVQLKQPLPSGTLLMIYRPGMTLTDPVTAEELGILAHNVGTVQMTGKGADGQWEAQLVLVQDAVQVGDRLIHAQEIPMDFQRHTRPFAPVRGTIIALPEAGEMAGRDQVVVVTLGRRDRVAQGLVLTVEHTSSATTDPVTGQTVNPVSHPIGEATLLLIGEKASFALLGPSSYPVSRGDTLFAQ